MTLPQINEEFSFIKINLPSGKKIGIRGWKVKDEKELLFAVESDENQEENKTLHIINFLRNCVDNQATYDKLGEQDLKKIAIETRKLSKGDRIEYNYQCPHCNFKMFNEIHLSKSVYEKAFNSEPIKINDDLSFTLKDVAYTVSNSLYEKYASTPSHYVYYYLINSIEAITYKGETFTQFSIEELDQWIEKLNPTDLDMLYKEFEEKTSEVKLEQKIKCVRCKEEFDMNFGNIFDFLVF